MGHKLFKNIDSKGVSVVIVTYNGTQRIIPTLKHLTQQTSIDFNWEILIIDNNSTDKTIETINEFWHLQNKPFPLRIIKEEKPGTMFARYRGMLEANYRYLLFCDDDNWLHPNYVNIAYQIITKDPNIAAVGGKGVIQYEQGFLPPDWMREAYERSFGTGSQDKDDGNITNKKGSLYTAGAIFDRVWLDRLYQYGFYSVLKGRDGKSLVAGEDTELTFALKAIGGQLFYSSQMHFKHYMPETRINWQYLSKLWNAFGFSSYIISAYNLENKTSLYSYFTDLARLFKRLLLLYFEKQFGNLKEGDKKLLLIELYLGCLNAMIFSHNKFLDARKMAVKLNSIKK